MSATTPATSGPAPTTRSALRANGWKIGVAVLLIALAAAVVVLSFAAFTSETASAGNAVASGSMTVTSSNTGAVFTATGLIPGGTATGTVDITNVGDAKGKFTLTTTITEDLAGTAPGSKKLSEVMTLRVVDVTDNNREIYNALWAAMPAIDLGTWNPNTTHKFSFTATLPSSAGNEYQGGSMKGTFTWSAVAVSS